MLVPQGEWERDRQGLPAMTGPVFFDAAFEMVDQWSPSVKASDIVCSTCTKRATKGKCSMPQLDVTLGDG